MLFSAFLQATSISVISSDTMMNKAIGPVWHRKHQRQGLIPNGLRGLDWEATWSDSKSDGWVYGHGSFCLVSHRPVVLGAFKAMRNSAHDAKRLWWETGHLQGLVQTVMMDSKADDQALFVEFRRQRGTILLTWPRRNSNHTVKRRAMIRLLNRPRDKRLYKERGQTVEPMQGLVKDIFGFERWWMRGQRKNRWLFATMGVAVQLQQAKALKERRSARKIKQEVLGL
jgi:hypothetical protein